MIESAEEFIRLSLSDDPDETWRSVHEEVPVDVLLKVIDQNPDLTTWVVHNKKVPIEILELLAKHHDPDVRIRVAQKRKLTEAIMMQLTDDVHETVRLTLAANAKATKKVLKKLSTDEWEVVRDCAKEKLAL